MQEKNEALLEEIDKNYDMEKLKRKVPRFRRMIRSMRHIIMQSKHWIQRDFCRMGTIALVLWG